MGCGSAPMSMTLRMNDAVFRYSYLISHCGNRCTGLAMVLVLSATVFNTQAQAQEVDPEWPCIQRLIPKVSPAIMWPVPVAEDMLTAYRSDKDIRRMAEEFGDLENFTEAHQMTIGEFAESVPEAEREMKLTLLATGIVDVSNRVRSDFIGGIKRYTRQQIAISEQIEATLNELSEIEAQGEGRNAEEHQEVLDTLRWHERVYDQRERSIQLLCEEPVELEEKLSEILRYAAQYLP